MKQKRDLIYPSIRPNLAIEIVKSVQLGRCFYSTTYRVTSTLKLSDEQIHALSDAGFLGIGQAFYIRNRHEPAGEDTLKCVEYIDGKATDNIPFNEYSKKPYEPIQAPYYVYECESQVDSGD